MNVKVRLFAAARQWAESDSLTVTCPEDATLVDLRQAIERDFPGSAALLPHVRFAVNAHYVRRNINSNRVTRSPVFPRSAADNPGGLPDRHSPCCWPCSVRLPLQRATARRTNSFFRASRSLCTAVL